MSRYPLTYFRLVLLILLFLSIGGYGLFQMRNLILGPVITLSTPSNGAAVSDSLIPIVGSTKNIAFISLNDRAIFIDEEGYFNEQVLLSYGYNILTLKARDKFGRETIKTLELIYK